jgi:hypothetical protein
LDFSVLIAPDTVVGRDKKLREIDPASEGKRLLEELTRERDRQILTERCELSHCYSKDHNR